jgi:anti-sigma factor RsiW
VDAHLSTCPACRSEAARDAEALALASLPPSSDAERRALAQVPRRALAELRQAEQRRGRWKRSFAGIAVAAAALLAISAPALLGRPTHLPAATTAGAVAWQSPDLDTVWEDTAVLDLDSTTNGDAADAALAALDL